MSLIGIHISDILHILEPNNKNIRFYQFFVSSQTDYSKEKYQKVIQKMKSNKIYSVVHASYSINLGKNWTPNDWWIQQMIGEIKASSKLKSFSIVIHTGKKLQLSTNIAINNMYTSLLYIHEKTIKYNVKILIETPSGQGTETLVDIIEFCNFMNKFYKHPNKKVRERFGICIDTCHIYASGYNICDKTIMDDYFNNINKIVGLDKIKLCHMNDSKGSLGSLKDRHDNFGNGNLGKKCILELYKFIKKMEIPIILETPNKNIYDDYIFLTNIS
jgi:deoxyribonuclease-4